MAALRRFAWRGQSTFKVRTIRKILLPDILCGPVSPLFYAAHGLLAWFRGRPVEQMKVDRVYLARKLESGGVLARHADHADVHRRIYAHFAYSCRYLRRRTRQQAKTL